MAISKITGSALGKDVIMKDVATADGSSPTLTLQTGDTDIAADDVLGSINFQAPDEGAGTDAILVAAGISAVSEGNFSSSNNATKLSFKTGASEAASEKMSLSSVGLLSLTNATSFSSGLTIANTADIHGSVIDFFNNSSSPADNDYIGGLVFKETNSAGGSHLYAKIFGMALDITDGTEDGALTFETSAGGANTAEIMRINNTGVGIGFTAPTAPLDVRRGDAGGVVAEFHNTSGFGIDIGADSDAVAYISSGYTQAFAFKTNAGSGQVERMRIQSGGNVSIGKTANNATTAGIALEATGTVAATRAGAVCGIFDRLTNDGEVIRINQANTTEGTISTSGSTVSYNAFSGSHWSRLADNSKPTILRGTVIETIDEMCDWYQAEYTSQEEEKYKDGDDIPDGKKVGDIKQDKIIVKDSIALPEGKKVGDTITHTVDEVDYTAKILQEVDYKHPKCKVSDTADCTNVYGVFLSWDNDDDCVNDMYVTAVGTNVVRIHKDQTVSKGDLLTSNGDGTAKKQDDDIIRSKTIGKVLSNKKQETYDDGSYTIPSALYCG